MKNNKFWLLLLGLLISTHLSCADEGDRKNRDRHSDGGQDHHQEHPKVDQAPHFQKNDHAEKAKPEASRWQPSMRDGRRQRPQPAPTAQPQLEGRKERQAPAFQPPATREAHRGSNVPSHQANPLINFDRNALKHQSKQFYAERNRQSRQESSNPQEIKKWLQQRQEREHRDANAVSKAIKKNYPAYSNWFNDGFYRRQHYHPRYWNADINWWQGPSWPAIYPWLGWKAQTPIYYYNGYPIELSTGWNSYGVGGGSGYFPSVQGEWMPLGVFTLGANMDDAARSDIFLQLALNRNGDIAGTYYNASTNTSLPIIGFVDPQTQEAYWRILKEEFSPQMTTGLFNLTQDVANIQLNFSGNVIQNWIIVRVYQ